MTRWIIILAVIVYLLWKWVGSSVTAITDKLGATATASASPTALSDSPETPQVVKSTALPAPAPVLISNIMPVPTVVKGIAVPTVFGTGISSLPVETQRIILSSLGYRM